MQALFTHTQCVCMCVCVVNCSVQPFKEEETKNSNEHQKHFERKKNYRIRYIADTGEGNGSKLYVNEVTICSMMKLRKRYTRTHFYK